MSSITKWTGKPSSALAWKPTEYMRRAMRWIVEHPCCGLFLDPGLRKTSITLGSFKALRKAGMVRRMLVVAPIRVCYNVWPAEVKKWKDFNDLKIVVLHGDEKTEANLLDESVDIYVINPEGLEWLLGMKGPKKGVILPNKERFKKLDCQMFVLDESSKFKNTQTKRFKLLKPFLPKFLRRVILTGSPAPKNLLDLFGQVYIMDLGRSLGEYITHYRGKYFQPTGFGGYTWILAGTDEKERKATAAKIHKAVKPYVLRMEAEDYITIPKLLEPEILVDLPSDARKMYEEMEDDLIVLLEAGESLSAPTAAAARTKCVQIANGAIYANATGLETRSANDYYEIHEAKLEALGDYLDERQGQPTLVFYWFKHDLIRIRAYMAKKFGKEFANMPSISEVSAKEAKLVEDRWNRNEYPVLLANPASAGHGLNMQEGQAAHALWFTLPDDYDIYDQSNRRLRRSGNTNSHVIATRIVARDTVDVAKGFLLRRKGASQKEFLDAMKTIRRNRK